MRGTRRSRVIAVAALGIAAIAIGAVMWRAGNPPPGLGRYAIYLTDVATGATTLWRSAPDRDLWAPDWSPDGKMIAWHETVTDNAPADLMVANRDGGGVHRIAAGSHASWSPDGRSIAFEAQIEQAGNFDIYVIDLATGATRRLTTDPALDWAPSWSPDGRTIGFTSRRTGADQLYAIDADGTTHERAVAAGSGSSVRLAWSSDGSRIAFGSDRTGDAEIYVAQPDGTQVVALTDNTAPDWDPVWSPDGRRIAFLSYRDGPPDLYTMDADGTHQTRLTHDSTMDETGGFEWSPDGASIVHAAAIRG
jgi:Tol biopolymer transport system component